MSAASIRATLAERFPESPPAARLKAALLYYGIRYDATLPPAAAWAFPNFMPYMLPPGVPSWQGQRKVDIPYLVRFDDGMQVRIRIKENSPFVLRADGDPSLSTTKFTLFEGDETVASVTFERRQPWISALTADGTPMRAVGLTQHGDMLVLNVAPGCEYFVVPTEAGRTTNLSCSFCLYGLPDQRMKPLGQELYVVDVPRPTIDRVIEACRHPETEAEQLYLVGGSMLSMEDEGERYLRIAERLAEAGLTERYYVTCGSGAILKEHMVAMKSLGVRAACFNLEVWDPAQFARVCPGKSRVVGRDRWLRSLEDAVDVFGPDDTFSAFVAGAELDGEGCLPDAEAALASNVEAAEYLIPRGVQPVFSLHWKMTGKERHEEPIYSLDHFLRLNERTAAIRARHGRPINPAFFSKRSAYMQLEPDFDDALRR